MTRSSLKRCIGIVGLGISFAATAPLKAAPSLPWDEPTAQPSHTLKNGAHIINLKSGQTRSNINFGNRYTGTEPPPPPPPPPPAIIQGMKWHDINGDGKIDSGEPGLAGVTIFLDLNDNGVREENEPRQITNEQGRYIFSGLEAGTYVVREVVPADYQQTYPPVK